MNKSVLIDVHRCTDKADVVRILRAEFESGRWDLPESNSARILLKPNFNSDMIGLTGNTTDLRVIIGLIEILHERGFRNLVIADGTSSGFIDHEIDVLERLRVREIGRRYSVDIVDLNEDAYVERATYRGAAVRIARTVMDSDFLINLPKLKTHGEARMSAALKNLVGCVVGLDKQTIHESLIENIVWLSEQIRSDLVIVDGIVGMEGLGPSLGTPIDTNLLLISNNAYAVEYVCASLQGYDDPSDLPVIQEMLARGKYRSDEQTAVDSIDFAQFARPFVKKRVGRLARVLNVAWLRRAIVRLRYLALVRRAVRIRFLAWCLRALGLRQDVFVQEDAVVHSLRYTGGQETRDRFRNVCPMGIDPGSEPDGDLDCIRCMYCYFALPEGAIGLEGDLGHMNYQLRRYRAHIGSPGLPAKFPKES